ISTEPTIDRRGDLVEEGGAKLKKTDILPVTRESNTRAALVFGSYNQAQYDTSTQAIIDQLQTQMRSLMKIVLARQEITVLKSQEDFRASIDPLTGLYNLEFLVGFLQQQLLFSYRQRLPVGLAIIDVDHLGQINQDFGFDVGDTVLTTIANRLLSKTRASDLIARYGGDEFAVVLPNTDGAGAKILGEKVRRDIEQLSFPTGTGKKGTKVTVSVGCANFTMDDMNPETILRDAKLALQKAKEAGTNSVAI
ncbi:MAG: GGDEF domain-containing protein, partial [Cyanobacteria bacterium]|nr:GGDEF domain-containing protein [Cyanobacteriota bacterium]